MACVQFMQACVEGMQELMSSEDKGMRAQCTWHDVMAWQGVARHGGAGKCGVVGMQERGWARQGMVEHAKCVVAGGSLLKACTPPSCKASIYVGVKVMALVSKEQVFKTEGQAGGSGSGCVSNVR